MDYTRCSTNNSSCCVDGNNTHSRPTKRIGTAETRGTVDVSPTTRTCSTTTNSLFHPPFYSRWSTPPPHHLLPHRDPSLLTVSSGIFNRNVRCSSHAWSSIGSDASCSYACASASTDVTGIGYIEDGGCDGTESSGGSGDAVAVGG